LRKISHISQQKLRIYSVKTVWAGVVLSV